MKKVLTVLTVLVCAGCGSSEEAALRGRLEYEWSQQRKATEAWEMERASISAAKAPDATKGVWVGDHWEYPRNVHGMKHKKSDATP